MPSNDFSDDHVAELLKRDAKNSSIKYSTAGLQAFLPQRPIGQAPKPNTRFLRSIIRETDNHNAAILAKEAKDSRLRLKALQVGKAESQGESDDRRSRRDARACHYDSRHRHHRYQDQDEVRNLKRRREEKDNDDDERYIVSRNSKRSKSHHDHKYHACEKLKMIRHQSLQRGRSRSSEVSDEDDARSKRSLRHHRHRRRHRSLSRDRHTSRSISHNSSISSSPDRQYERSKNKRKESRKSRRTSRSPSLERSTNHSRRRRRRRRRSRRRQSISSSPKLHTSSHKHCIQTHKSQPDDISYANGRTHIWSAEAPLSPTPSEDSDPLAALIGPPPPPSQLPSPSRKQSRHQIIRSKGRGKLTTTSSSSAMDNHFAPNYNPSIDVQPDSDVEEFDDWDQALEALRDRQRWRQQGADRLLAAGFTPAEVQKWQKGGAGGEKDEDDVRWAKMGEGREWDRGKVVDEDGNVELRAEWGKNLKGKGT